MIGCLSALPCGLVGLHLVLVEETEGVGGISKPKGFPGGADSKESACSLGDLGSIPGSGRSSGGGHGNPLQCSCWRIPMDRGSWQATVHRGHRELDVAEQLSTPIQSPVEHGLVVLVVSICTALCPWKLTSVALSAKFPCPLAPVEVGQWEDSAGRQGKETEVGRVYLGSRAHRTPTRELTQGLSRSCKHALSVPPGSAMLITPYH